VKFEVVTSMNQSYYEKVGHRMINSFVDNWDDNVNLRVYSEDMFSHTTLSRMGHTPTHRVNWYDLFKVEPECRAFIERHKDRPDQQNKLELHLGAVRFAYKTFSVFAANKYSDADYVIWLDADVFTHTPISVDFLNTLVCPDVYTTYLGRENNYSECGFVIYNTKHPKHEAFQEMWRSLYTTDHLFQLPQWHDSFVFDCVRRHFEKHENLQNYNMTPEGGAYDHVFINSVLGDYMDHMKGPRKDRGRSDAKDLYTTKRGKYWDA
jgi:hypothetical protein